MTREQAAAALVDKTFQLLCFEKSSFSSEDVRQSCLDLINKEIERTVFLTEIIGE
jgi:hypothetical protein